MHAFVPDCTTGKRKTVSQAAKEVRTVVDVAVKTESEEKSAREKKRGAKRKLDAKTVEDGSGEEDGDM